MTLLHWLVLNTFLVMIIVIILESFAKPEKKDKCICGKVPGVYCKPLPVRCECTWDNEGNHIYCVKCE